MQQDDSLAAFATMVEKFTGVDRAEVTGDMRLREDLGIDSLSLIDVAIAAEDGSEIRISDEDLDHFQTVNDMVEYIRHATVLARTEFGPSGPLTLCRDR